MNDYPTFTEAIVRFRTFASSQEAPTEVMFLKPEDVVVSGEYVTVRRPSQRERLEHARATYDSAVRHQFGVEIAGVISCENWLGCYVYAPATDEESIERMMPDGLKLSIRTPLVKGYFGGPVIWALLRWRERRHPASVERKASLFGREHRPWNRN
jgi:hypothetical protein